MNTPPITLSRDQRRKLQRLSERIDRKILSADRAFFERFPNRSHRVRLASQLELQANKLLNPTSPEPPDGYAAYVAVRQLRPGIRMRGFFIDPSGGDTDLSEDEAHALYERVSASYPQARTIEQQLRTKPATPSDEGGNQPRKETDL